MSESTNPNCSKCRYYYVTWDKNMPHGCKIYSLKTNTIPSKVVEKQSGQPCLGFEEKKLKEQNL